MVACAASRAAVSETLDRDRLADALLDYHRLRRHEFSLWPHQGPSRAAQRCVAAHGSGWRRAPGDSGPGIAARPGDPGVTPAQGDSAAPGIRSSDRLAICIADVSGKGVPAA